MNKPVTMQHTSSESTDMSEAPLQRDEKGRILPGNIINYGGKPKIRKDFHDWLSTAAYPLARAALLECLQDADSRVKLAAVKEVHDRLFGKSPQPVTGEDGKPITFAIVVLPAEKIE